MNRGILLFIILLLLVVGVIHYNNQAQNKMDFDQESPNLDNTLEVTAPDVTDLSSDEDVFAAYDSVLNTLP